MISERARQAAETAARHARGPHWPLYTLAGIVVAAVSMLAFLYFVDRGRAAEDRAALQAQVAELAADAQQVADPLAELCRTDPTVAARAGDGCRKAAEVQQQPVEPVAVGPSAAEIRAAVADYLRRNPPPAGQSASLDQITAAVAGYLQANPPQPGRPPTVEEVRAAVAEYIAANPPAPGRDGTDGEPGRPPTDAEIDAAVARYFAANPPPAGPPGEPGEPGRGIASTRVEDCRLLVTYTTGETVDVGETCSTTTVTVPAPEDPPADDGGLLPDTEGP